MVWPTEILWANTNDISATEILYAHPYVMLTHFGAWNLVTGSRTKNILYRFYQIIMLFFGFCGIISFGVDFFNVYGNFKKMCFNLSFSIIYSLEIAKQSYMYYHKDFINDLRQKLQVARKYRSLESTKYPSKEETTSMKEFKAIYSLYYYIYLTCLPAGFVIFYMNSSKGFRFPLWTPLDIDHIYADFTQFHIYFAAITVFSLIWLLFAIEVEMSMFSLIIQISGEYRNLMKTVPLLNKIHLEAKTINKSMKLHVQNTYSLEVNPILKKAQTKKFIKHIIKTQQDITK